MPRKNKVRVAVLVSGGGTNLQAILDAQKSGKLESAEIALVISNKEGAYAIERAKAAGVPAYTITKASCGSAEAFETKLIETLDANQIEVIVLAGFLSILSKRFTSRYPDRILNVHPSLIPAFCGEGFYGLKVHKAVLESGVKVTGATVHFVNEIPDGGKIIAQKAVRVKEGDTPESLQKRVMVEAERQLLPKALESVCAALLGQTERKEEMELYAIPTIGERLFGNTYPGRGIVIGKSENAKYAVSAYFIMGRSLNSRNRVFVKRGGEVFTEPYDASKVEDPSLIIYAAVREYENRLVVTNGDQTDTIVEGLKAGISFSKALESREFEPDAPNYTPRISGMITFENGDFTYEMSILKSVDASGGACARYTFSYPSQAGLGHFLHTYVCDGNPIPTFQGEPERIAIGNDIDGVTRAIWEALDENNRISLYVRFTDLETGKAFDRIVNKNQ